MASIDGSDTGTGYGVSGTSSTGIGVIGAADPGIGVVGRSATGTGVAGSSKDGSAVVAEAGAGIGLDARADAGTAVLARSVAGPGLVVEAPRADAMRAKTTLGRGLVAEARDGVAIAAESERDNGVLGITDAPGRAGVFGLNRSQTDGGTGVTGLAQGLAGIGVFGSAALRGTGVVGNGATGMLALGAAGPGLRASSEQQEGVLGLAARDGFAAVRGEQSGRGPGVRGESAAGTGVEGKGSIGVQGETDSATGPGVLGRAGPVPAGGWPALVGAVAGMGNGLTTPGVAGIGLGGLAAGVSGESHGGVAPGVMGQGFVGVRGASSAGGLVAAGVEGTASGNGAIGVRGLGPWNGTGVFGSSSSGIGVWGLSNGSGTGIYGFSPNPTNAGPYAWAGRFQGAVNVTGPVHKSGGGFRIDHPDRPESHYLQHWFVESDAMRNLYDGIVTLDGDGAAEVTLPGWFAALNEAPRYQLTALGGPAPELHIAREISDGRFAIAGGRPGQRVSWQVTATRQDPWAQANRLPVEIEKAPEERGHYRHPELYDAPRERGVDHLLNRRAFEDPGFRELLAEPARPRLPRGAEDRQA